MNVVLRELTEAERAELSRFKLYEKENDYQVLLAMIAVDMMKEKAYSHPLDYSEYREYVIETRHQRKTDGFIIAPIINSWLRKMVEKTGGEYNEKIEKDIWNLTFTYIYIIGQNTKIPGKKPREMFELYKEHDKRLREKNENRIADSPEYMYRYIVSCLEYMGFERRPTTDMGIVDMTHIYYGDLD